MKHIGPRDVPHPRQREKRVDHFTETARARKRVRMEDGRSFPAQSLNQGTAPRRPPICMLFEDLAPIEPPTGVFGMYPDSLIPKLLPWLRCDRRQVLHVCSGGLPPGEGIRVDLRPAARPDFVADGRSLPFSEGTVAAVLIDPPYSEHYARELYGTDYPLPSHLLREAARVVRPGGRIGFVHYLVPNPPPRCHHVKTFGLSMGFGYPMRAVTFYEKAQDELRWEANVRTQPVATLSENHLSAAPPPEAPPARAENIRREPPAVVSGAGVDAPVDLEARP